MGRRHAPLFLFPLQRRPGGRMANGVARMDAGQFGVSTNFDFFIEPPGERAMPGSSNFRMSARPETLRGGAAGIGRSAEHLDLFGIARLSTEAIA